jgi:acyl carrier protein
MNDQEILEKVSGIIQDIIGDYDIVLTPESSAEDVPEWDSMNHINIVVGIELAFGIKFHMAELEEAKNIGGLIELIKAQLAKS